MSENLKYDVPFDVAALDFIKKGYASKYRDNFCKNHSEIEACKDSGELERILEKHDADMLHRLLKDGNYSESDLYIG